MAKKKIYRAGMIIYHLTESNEIKILFMMPSKDNYGTPYFQIPKGKIEEGESPEDAAVRESKEEVGLFKPNIDGKIHHLGNFLGRTEMYVAKIKDVDQFGDPHHETKETKWMTPKEFQAEGRGLHKPVVKAGVRFIKKKEGLK